MIHAKALQEVETNGTGGITAVFSRFGVVDLDGDVTLPDAIEDGAIIQISQWMHGSWQAGLLPAGAGRIVKGRSEARIVGEFFLNTDQGRNTYQTLRGLGQQGIGVQWSYGFDIVDSFQGDFKGRRVRYLTKLDVFEASPVLRGAGGPDVRTVELRTAAAEQDIKDQGQRELLRCLAIRNRLRGF